MINRSIPKAFHSLERKEITVDEYETYLNMHPYQKNIKPMKCIECGDLLTYISGNSRIRHFRHAASHEGHSYCSLYTQGVEANTNEAMIRKKFFKEEDISFNYELLYQNGKWVSLITIPPFKLSEIEENEKNKTKILIKNENDQTELPIDKEHFKAGEIKIIGLNNFSSKVNITIKGNSTKNEISYNMNGFNPLSQMYSSLILQEFDGDREIDLKNIKRFVCKRISGKVYTGRHYLIFSDYNNFNNWYKNKFSNSIEIKRIELTKDRKFRHCLYDVVFKEVNNDTIKFCNDRNSILIQKDDAMIIWPPTKMVGNYRYYNNIQTKMFISYENDNDVLDLKDYEIFTKENAKEDCFFKVKNVNSNSYYVTLDEREVKSKEDASIINNQKFESINMENYEKKYQLYDDVIIREYDSKFKLKKKSGLLFMNNPLDRFHFKQEESFDLTQFVNAIRYNREYIRFDYKYCNYLRNKYKNNNKVIEYIKHCEIVGTIKKKALEILLEGGK